MCDDRFGGPHVWHGSFPFDKRTMAQMKRFAGRFMRNFMGSYVPYNIENLGTEYLITVPLPGRTKEDVKVSLINKNLNINAKKPKISESEKEDRKEKNEFPFPFHGFSFVDVDMDIPLPADADEDSIVSKMANGLLTIKIGKKPAKHIDINEGENN